MDKKLSPKEAAELGALDPQFYSQYYFPKTFRQGTPAFHQEIWQLLDDPSNRYTAIEVFRGGAKTTLLRTYASRKIAYGLAHTILFVSEAQNHALKSLEWIMRAVTYNKQWAQTFGLEKGLKWSGEEIEIIHKVAGFSIRVIALGITGQTRGINIDDYRPDLIIVDDPNDEENTATPDQREKISDLFFGALAKSLAPRSEAPDAKMVLLQTPLNPADLVESCLKDKQWASARYSCFDEAGESRWPQRFPTQELVKEKEAHIARNQLSLWLREMECSIVSRETSSFRAEWLKFYELPPEDGATYMAIDPASSDAKTADDQAIATVRFWKGAVYLLEYGMAKGQTPDKLAVQFFAMCSKWRPIKCGVETISYQRTLKWYLEQKMEENKQWVYVTAVTDRRKKRDRIIQALTGLAANGQLYVHASHREFIQQFTDYPDVQHDDLLDAVAMAISMANPAILEGGAIDAEYSRIQEEERDIEALGSWRVAL